MPLFLQLFAMLVVEMFERKEYNLEVVRKGLKRGRLLFKSEHLYEHLFVAAYMRQECQEHKVSQAKKVIPAHP